MAMRTTSYPSHWKEIRAAVLARARYRCEGCPPYPQCRAENGKPHPVTGSLVVLTTAHKHGTSTMTQNLGDLMALCQRCHLAYDKEMHLRHAAETRRRRRAGIPAPWAGVADDDPARVQFRQEHPIAEVIASGGVQIRPRQNGRYLVGPCPFHDNRWPSFWVCPETARFGCLGCDARGDVIDFLGRYEVRVRLALAAGLTPPEVGERFGLSRSSVDRIAQAQDE